MNPVGGVGLLHGQVWGARVVWACGRRGLLLTERRAAWEEDHRPSTSEDDAKPGGSGEAGPGAGERPVLGSRLGRGEGSRPWETRPILHPQPFLCLVVCDSRIPGPPPRRGPQPLDLHRRCLAWCPPGGGAVPGELAARTGRCVQPEGVPPALPVACAAPLPEAAIGLPPRFLPQTTVCPR